MRKLILLISCLSVLKVNAQNVKFKLRPEDQERVDAMREEERNRKIADSIKEAKASDEMHASNDRWMRQMEKKYGKANIQKAIDGEYWVGMAEEIAWLPHGEASNIRTTYTKEGKTETWYFRNTRTTISLKNHRVVAITKSND